MNIVCRLGAFHTEMSFLGSIGTLMKRSGIKEAMQTCYGIDTVTHILSGKAVARAVRTHCLVASALTIKLLRMVLTSEGEESRHIDLEKVSNLCDKARTQEWAAVEEAEDVKILLEIENRLNVLKQKLTEKSQLAKLWLQYVNYVEILKLSLHNCREDS
jgi:hypothetical protein